jgi:hypothetical protein
MIFQIIPFICNCTGERDAVHDEAVSKAICETYIEYANN